MASLYPIFSRPLPPKQQHSQNNNCTRPLISPATHPNVFYCTGTRENKVPHSLLTGTIIVIISLRQPDNEILFFFLRGKKLQRIRNWMRKSAVVAF